MMNAMLVLAISSIIVCVIATVVVVVANLSRPYIRYQRCDCRRGQRCRRIVVLGGSYIGIFTVTGQHCQHIIVVGVVITPQMDRILWIHNYDIAAIVVVGGVAAAAGCW